MSEIKRLGNLILTNGGNPRVQVANLVRLVPEEDRTSSLKQYTLKLQNGNSVRVFHAPDFSRAIGRRLSERVFIAKFGSDGVAFFLLRATRNGVYFRADPCSAQVGLNLANGMYFPADPCSAEVGMNLASSCGYCDHADQRRVIKLIVAAIAAADNEVPTRQPVSPKAKAVIDALRAQRASIGVPKPVTVIEPVAPPRTWKILMLDPKTLDQIGNLPELYTDEAEARKKMGERAMVQPNALFVKVEFQERVQAKLALDWS